MPFIATFLFFEIVYSLTNYFIHWPLLCGLFFSVWSWFAYGEGDYSKFRPSGNLRVGYREFKSKEFGNDCSIFYPAASDGSGTFEVPFLPYGEKNLKALLIIVG